MSKYFHITTYGCQMNVHESEKIAGILSRMGYTACDNIEDSDIAVFNTCCIRENAENHAFGNIGMLKKLKAKKRDMLIAVGGCLTQQIGKADTLHDKFPYVDIIFGTHNLNELEELINKKLRQKKAVIEIDDSEGAICEGETPLRTSYPNAWINITYGCNNFCSYCIVPYVRGRERSRRSADIIKEAQELIAQGYKELTLLGQNVNSYANGTNDLSFPELLKRIAGIEGKFRLRFMTSHPKDFSEELAKVIAENPKICRAVHLPVQSGSDSVLKAMNRKYTAADYIKKIEILKKYVPDCAVTTDLIVGFPNESEEQFQHTLDIVNECQFDNAYTFIYSPREGTPAAKMTDNIPLEVKQERLYRLNELVNHYAYLNNAAYRGKIVKVLVDGPSKKNPQITSGYTETNKLVNFVSKNAQCGDIVEVRITDAKTWSLDGEQVE